MQVEQYVMAYEVEQDRLRALLPADLSPCGLCCGSTVKSGGDRKRQPIWS